MLLSRTPRGNNRLEPLRVSCRDLNLDTCTHASLSHAPQSPGIPNMESSVSINPLDAIQTSSGRFIYECVWGRGDEGRWWCAFALNIYNWVDLGRTYYSPGRGCAGFYTLADNSLPVGASVETLQDIRFDNIEPFDPFGP